MKSWYPARRERGANACRPTQSQPQTRYCRKRKALPEKFELEYTAPDGSRQRPIMIHRALFGSVERFFGILIEHYAGRFPLWISPHQVRIITVADRHEPYGQELAKKIKDEPR